MIRRRATLFGGEPGNLKNALPLIDLYLADKDYGNASKVLTVIFENEPTELADRLEFARLGAKFYQTQSNSAEGARLYTELIDSLDVPMERLASKVALARYHFDLNENDEGVAVLEGARADQSAEMMEADRTIGDYYFSVATRLRGAHARGKVLGETEDELERMSTERDEAFEQALGAYKKIADSGADIVEEGNPVTQRMAETLIALGRHDESKRLLETMISNAPGEYREDLEGNLQILLLRAEMIQASGNLREAKTFIDRACELYPNQASPFLRRAMLNQNDESLFSDVIADLDRVNELKPSLLQPWAMRFALYKRRNDTDTAFAQLRRGIDRNPNNDTLPKLMIQQFRVTGRAAEAQQYAVKVAADRDVPMWYAVAGQLCVNRGAYVEGVKQFEKLYALAPSPENAAWLLDSVLRTDRGASLAVMKRLLGAVEAEGSPMLDTSSVFLVMLRARARMAMNEVEDAQRYIRGAYEVCDGDTGQLRIWLDQLILAMGSVDAASRIVKAYAQREVEPSVFMQLRMIEYGRSDESFEATLAKLEALGETIDDDELARFETLTLQESLYYGLGRYDEAMAACRAGLEIRPGNIILNNDLAYMLVKQKGDAEAALPYALAAVENSLEQSSPLLDTLGFVYLQMGNHRDARVQLNRALQTADNPRDKFTASLHMGETLKALGDVRGAYRRLANAERLLKEIDPREVEILQADLDSLREALK